jgi:hypothetical protein
MRTIDADALYETLCHIWDRSDSEEFEQAVFESIANAPTVEVPHWTPCSKRLPREEEQDDELGVLVTLGNGYSGLQCDWYHGDHWYDWDGFVVAWMEMPPVYQEEDNK